MWSGCPWVLISTRLRNGRMRLTAVRRNGRNEGVAPLSITYSVSPGRYRITLAMSASPLAGFSSRPTIISVLGATRTTSPYRSSVAAEAGAVCAAPPNASANAAIANIRTRLIWSTTFSGRVRPDRKERV